MAESQSKGDTFINQSGSFGIGVNKGEVRAYNLAGTINESQPKNMIEVVSEIQDLLKYLGKTNPTNSTKEKMAVAMKAIEQIENNPTLKQRTINAAKEEGITAFEKAFDNPIGTFVVSAIRDWLK